ncbi:DUF4258 domain-containing protein [Geobacter pickeringii]|uniref:DUF4258 domain-containing protein n=1 Tax=Geobacter pickeringii TaxID=345632 RepID=A0A0B5BAV6_9BACT|nr:DUF4258 domain-containing protein [Geobacter pickeringii]AJE03878.1 hypothetical protein GPICK_11405 [Geobacter pickeringii]
MPFNISTIRSLAASDKMALKRHSILRMHQRRIAVDELKEALLFCELVEGYPTDRPLPSGLVLGHTAGGRTLHAVVAIDQDEQMLWIITVYEPTPADWEEGFTQRR